MITENTPPRTILITGSTRGLGYAMARRFAAGGYTLAVHGRDNHRCQEVARSLQAEFKTSVVGVSGDLSTQSGAETVFKQTIAALPTIDVLINNAGLTRDKLLLRMTEEDWDQVMQTNLTATFRLTKAVLKPMLRARKGRIINVASIVGQMGNAGQANYAASKGGMIAFTKALAREVAAKSITINVVAPGYIETDMTAALDERARDQFLTTIPLQRFGTPAEVAAVAYFLASNDAAYITGQVLAVNGGLLM